MQSEETFIGKNFLILNQSTGVTVQCYINVPYLLGSREINFSRALTQIHLHTVSLTNSHIFYLDFQKRMHVFVGQYPFHQEILLKYELFLGDSIQIRYRKIVSPNQITQQSCPPLQKKKKVKQRTIKQAVNAVTLWRQLYELTDQRGKRIFTLESAAQKIGYAKKTLDDYFNQLRLAQYYQFNIQEHLGDKIGVLRQFVRTCQKREEQKQKKITQQKQEHNNIDKYFEDHPESSDDDDKLF